MEKGKKINRGEIENIDILFDYIHKNFSELLNKLTEVLTMKAELNMLINNLGKEEVNKRYEDFKEFVKMNTDVEKSDDYQESDEMTDDLSEFFDTNNFKNKTIN